MVCELVGAKKAKKDALRPLIRDDGTHNSLFSLGGANHASQLTL